MNSTMSSKLTSASSIDRTMWMASSMSSLSSSWSNAKGACVEGWRWSSSFASDRKSASKGAFWRAQTSSFRSIETAAVGDDIHVVVDDGM